MISINIEVSGVRAVENMLDRKLQDIARRMRGAMLAGGEVVKRESLYVVPIDKGVLRDSFYMLAAGSGFNFVLSVGYMAPYAVFVHEDLTKAHGAEFNAKYASEIASGREHARRPQEKAKFLEGPIKEHMAEIRTVIASAMGATGPSVFSFQKEFG